MIFQTPNATRWRCFRLALCLVAAFVIALVGDLAISLFTPLRLPAPEHLPPSEAIGATERLTVPSGAFHPQPLPGGEHPPGWQRLFVPGVQTRTAFLSQESASSLADLRRHLNDLDVVFPNQFQWTSAATGLEHEVKDDFTQTVAGSAVRVLPLLSNADASGAWHAKEVGEMLANRRAGDELIQTLAREYTAVHAAGINVDFETLAPDTRKSYAAWLGRLAEEFHRRSLLVTVDVPPGDPAFDYAAIGRAADAVIVMAYDEHYPSGEPGPVASAAWLREGVEKLSRLIPPGRLLLGLGTYGYDWDTTAGGPARPPISFAEAMFMADSMDAGVDLDTLSLNEHFEFTEPDGDAHEIWLQDAVSIWNHLQGLKNLPLGGFALWRLGLEEQGVWEFLKDGHPSAYPPEKLAAVRSEESIVSAGEGEIFQVRDLPAAGSRELTVADGVVTYSTFTHLPRFAVVEKHGHSDERKVALTFDDGPDPRWTPEILQILRENGVHGTFFLVGSRAEAAPQLVLQEYAAGHTLGNHTFSHPKVTGLSHSRLRMELDATQRAIEAATGRQSTLFRLPFDTEMPLTPAQLDPEHEISKLGYYLVGADADSEDTLPHTAEAMVRNVLRGLKESGGNIVVFHDFGTRRERTVAAVRALIPELKAQGYEFVTVDQLLGFPRDFVMPAAPAAETPFILGYQAVGWLAAHVWPFITGLLWVVAILALVRVLLLGTLIFHSAVRRRVANPNFQPRVAVLIPAYNEATVIRRTIEGVLRSDYPDLHVVVVSDGSTDGTDSIVSALAAIDRRVKLLVKENGGKSSALNLGFREIEEDYIVTIDADTIILPATISHLVAPFADPRVDAVCGNVQVGNRHSLLTRFQDAEYVTTQNFDRRAFEAINCITVVPGATGAWKRRSILAMGAYSEDTLTEDADLTITVIAAGGRIVYAPLGKSVTEAPEDLSGLWKQRFRWSYGMLQSLWKHRRCFGKGLLGWIALPNILAQIALQQLGPLCDLLLIIYLVMGQFGGVARTYLLLTALDMFACLVAFKLDGRRLRSLWVVPIQRFAYRPFLYAVAVNAIVAAFRGKHQGWNKLRRTGTVVCEAASKPMTEQPGIARALASRLTATQALKL